MISKKNLVDNGLRENFAQLLPDEFNLPWVADEMRGFLVYRNNTWVYERSNDIKKWPQKVFSKSENTRNFVILLESPHKSEFKDKNHPRPAMGTTGKNIRDMLAKIVSDNSELLKKMDTSFIYRVFLVNSVQYQTSCYCFTGHVKGWRSIRDIVFKTYMEDPVIQDDLCNRLVELVYPQEENILIDCVTQVLKKTVWSVLDKKNINHDLRCYHPAYWGSDISPKFEEDLFSL